MQGMVDQVKGFLRGNLPPGGRLGLAVSGGLDSMVLLDLVCRSIAEDISVTVLHFDHALRPDSSADASFVRTTAEARGLPVIEERRDATTRPFSGEDDARHARYAFFARAARERELAGIATAHTADDQAETVLFRLFRGAGSRGLAGIPAVREHDGFRLLRPLLENRRSELERYARSHNLAWREDPSNSSLVFARNRIRHQVLPFLAEHTHAGLVESLCGTAAILRSEDDFLEQHVRTELECWERGEGGWSRSASALEQLHPAIRSRVLLAVLKSMSISVERETVILVEETRKAGNRLDLSSTVSARCEGEGSSARFTIGKNPTALPVVHDAFPLAQEGETVIAPLGLRVALVREGRPPGVAALRSVPAGFTRVEGPWRAHAWFAKRWVGTPLFLRTWQEGDRITPLGMMGARKLHDLFIDEKISLADRGRWPLVCAGDKVLWVVGLRQDESTRVEAGDDAVLRLDVVADGDDDDGGLVA